MRAMATWGLLIILFSGCSNRTQLRAEDPLVVGDATPEAASDNKPSFAYLESEQTRSTVREALARIRSGEANDGITMLREALQADPSSALAAYNLAVIEHASGDLDKAEAHARQAIENSGGRHKTVSLFDTIMRDAGKSGQLRSVYEPWIERWPEALPIRNALARLLIDEQRPSDALRDASEMLKKDEANLEVMKTIARAYLAMERIQAAEMVLLQTLELGQDAEVLNLLAQIAMRQKDAQKAMALFQKALAKNANLADAHNNLGVLYHEAGDYEAAIREFEAAIRLSPKYSKAYMNLGNAQRKSLDFRRATDAYKEALALDPGCAECHFNLGLASLENRGTGRDDSVHYRRAIDHLRRYKEMRRGTGGEDADKYMDEARRMAEALEREERARPAPEGENSR